MRSALKHVVMLGIAAAIVVGVLTVQLRHTPTAHASPPECLAGGNNGYNTCNDHDPMQWAGPDGVICNNDAYPQETDNYFFGWITNWWSANCKANWTQVYINSGDVLAEVEVDACAQGFGFYSNGHPECTIGPGVRECDVNPSNWADCTFIHQDIPPNYGGKLFYTYMVRGDWKTYSAGDAIVNGVSLPMFNTSWH